MHLNETKNATALKMKLARVLRAAGEEHRLGILCVIFHAKKVCVSDIANRTKLSVAIVSHHLRALERAGLLKPEREGKQICYLFEDNDFAKDLKRFICKYN